MRSLSGTFTGVFAQDSAAAAQAKYLSDVKYQGEAYQRLFGVCKRLAGALDKYYEKSRSLPADNTEIDKFLLDNYEAITLTGLPVPAAIQPKNQWRTLPGVAFTLDSRAGSLTRINNEWKFPETWLSPESVGCATDGTGTYVVWVSSAGRMTPLFQVGQPGATSR